MRTDIYNLILVVALAFSVNSIFAKGTYQEPEAFLNEVFTAAVPAVKKLWIVKEIKTEIRDIPGHDLGVLRLSYWQRDMKTAWILEEIGKSLPITVGIVVNENKIEFIRILIFRESRGWEVRYPFFTDQFNNVRLSQENQLDRGIDGISGATLSVNAVTRLATLALYLHQHINK